MSIFLYLIRPKKVRKESSAQEFKLALEEILGNIPSNILQDFSDILGEIENEIDNIEKLYVHLRILLFCYC